MKKKYYIAVCMKNCGKQWAFVMEWHGIWNLAECSVFNDPKVLSANICDSKKEAWRIVNGWNEEFRKAGIFEF